MKNADGALVPNAVVTFSTDATLATITPAATALTDASGAASVTLNSAGLAAAGAGTITATAQVGTPPVAVTGSIGFAVGTSAITITAPVFGVGATALSAFGTTSITVTVSAGGVPVTTPQNVTFSSACADSGKAVLGASVATVAGVATGSYRDNGCAGTDSIIATAAGVRSSAASLVVTPPSAGSVEFVSATPGNISLKGTGGVETSQVVFKVVDTGGNPISGKTVTFGLSTTVGGITLTPSIAGVSTAISDANGLVVITVNAGTVSTPVSVTAATPGTTGTLTTQSNALSVTTGIPAQDSFSLSATKLNFEAKNVDGNTTVLNARLADHFRNPVPNGTAVNFTTEGGQIVGSCQTVDGGCSVALTGQNPRPADGRVTVLAYAVGEESFIDLNGNGVADLLPANEMVDINNNSTDLPEAFRDDNENGVRDATETFIDFNKDGAFTAADGQFSGVLCDNVTAPPTGSSALTCAATRSIHVRDQIVIVFSGSTAVITLPASIDLDAGGGTSGCSGSQNIQIGIVDSIGNVMPVGTTIDLTTTDGTLSTSQIVVGNTNQLVTPPYSVSISGDGTFGTQLGCVDETLAGALTVKVTTPGGTVTSRSIPVSH